MAWLSALAEDGREQWPNRGRQRRASAAKRSPLDAGLAARVDAAMAPACGRERGHAT